MQLRAFVFLDTKTGIHHVPFFMSHVGQAVRAAADVGADLNTTIGRHPADYVLLEVGTYDDQNGVMMACAPINHGSVVGFLDQRPRPLPYRSVEEPEDGGHPLRGVA